MEEYVDEEEQDDEPAEVEEGMDSFMRDARKEFKKVSLDFEE